MRVALLRLIATGTTLCALIWTVPALADPSELDRIDALITLSQNDPAAAVLQLTSMGQSFNSSTPAVVRREHWLALTTLQQDGGFTEAARASMGQFADWARTSADEPGRLLASMLQSEDWINSGQVSQAYQQLLGLEQAALVTRDPRVMWVFYDLLGKARSELGKFELSIDSYLKALTQTEQLPRGRRLARMYSLEGLSNAYSSMHNWAKARELNQAALDIAIALDSRRRQASLYINLGVIYSGMGRQDDMERVNQLAMDLARQSGLNAVLATTLNNKADAQLKRADFAAAEATALLALEKYQETGRSNGVATARANIGLAQIGQGKIAQGTALVEAALKWFHNAQALADEEAVLGELSLLYERQGLTAKALATVRQQQVLSEQLFLKDREKAVANLQEIFEAAARQKRIESLAQDVNLKDLEIRSQRVYQLVIFLGALVASAFGLFALYLYRRVKRANSQLQELNGQLEFHSIRDPLTGLLNRRYFLEQMNRHGTETPRAHRVIDNPDGLMLVDIDHFKQVNDTLGHAMGDVVLVEVAQRLRRAVRDTDQVIRWGGEEFLIFSPRAGQANLRQQAQRILQSVASQPIQMHGHTLQVTVSVGFLTVPLHAQATAPLDWEAALRIADLSMYLGKSRGRNRACGVHCPEEISEPCQRLVNQDLIAAIGQGCVELLEILGPDKEHPLGESTVPMPAVPAPTVDGESAESFPDR